MLDIEKRIKEQNRINFDFYKQKQQKIRDIDYYLKVLKDLGIASPETQLKRMADNAIAYIKTGKSKWLPQQENKGSEDKPVVMLGGSMVKFPNLYAGVELTTRNNKEWDGLLEIFREANEKYSTTRNSSQWFALHDDTIFKLKNVIAVDKFNAYLDSGDEFTLTAIERKRLIKRLAEVE